jgi:hypothetical protein
MVSKRRQRSAAGMSSGMAKLTDERVRQIRDSYIKGDPLYGGAALAKAHGVSGHAISEVVHRRSWKHVA